MHPNTIDTTNTVDGKSIVYLVDAHDQTIDASSNAGLIFCERCSGMVIQDLTLSKGKPAVYLYDSSNNVIENLTITDSYQGVVLQGKSYYEPHTGNVIRNNTIQNSTFSGIFNRAGLGTEISENTVDGCSDAGIDTDFNDHRINGNTISNCRIGMRIFGENSAIEENTFSHNDYNLSWQGFFPRLNTFVHNNFELPNVQQLNITGGNNGQIFFLDLPVGGNFWGDFSPACADANADGFCDATYEFFFGRDFYPWKKKDGWKIPARNPVVIVPGVLGTELTKGGETLWADLFRMINPFNDDSFMDPLIFNSELKASNNDVVIGQIIKNPSNLFDYTEGIIQEFTTQGYIENQSLFTFPYDWRYGVSGQDENGDLVNVKALQEKIQDILTLTHATKVDIVAHSTGGLLVKKYVIDHLADHHIDKAVFVGVPSTGAPKTIKVLALGDNFNVLGLSDLEMQKISQNLPVVYDLAPSRTYFNHKGSFFRIIRDLPNYLTETINLDYDQTWDEMVNAYDSNITAIQNTQALHTPLFDDFDLRTTGIDLYSIVGCKSGSIGGIIKRVHGNDPFGNPIEGYDIRYVPGDGTVPLESSTNLPIDQEKKFYALKADHGTMMTQNGIRQQIVNSIVGTTLETKNLTQDITKCKLKGKAVSVFSPLLPEVFDQDNRRMGMAEDGSIQNEIPNADFSILGDHKFLYLPEDEDQVYTINLTGTGQGAFTLKVAEIDENEPTETEVFNTIPVTQDLKGNLELNNSQSILRLDTNGDSTIDQTLLPSAILDPDQAEDFIPPTTTAAIVGLQGNEGFYRSSVEIVLTATDPAPPGESTEPSGIHATYYRLDNTEFQPYSIPIAISTPGEHKVRYYSIDRAGNTELEQSIVFTIDTTAPEISIYFDTTQKDFVFQALDINESNPTIICQKKECMATDRSGNTTIIAFDKKKDDFEYELKFRSLAYRGQTPVKWKETVLEVEFESSKGKVREYDSSLELNDREVLEIDFNRNKSQSIVTTLSQNGKKVKQTVPGTKTIQVQTKKGDLIYQVF